MILYLTTIIVIIGLTRWLAYWGFYVLQPIGSIPVIENVFHLTYVPNTGAALGMFQDKTIMLSIIAIALFLGITYFVTIKKKTLTKDFIFALALVAGGGISNVVDRFKFGLVVDYFDFKFIPFWIWVFNLADTCVVLGTIYIGIKILMTKDEPQPNNAEDNKEKN